MNKGLGLLVAAGAFSFGAAAQEITGDQTLVASPASPGALFGVSVASDGELLVVGASDDSGSVPVGGAVYLFQRQGTAWSPAGRLESDDLLSGDFLGYSVGLSGDFLVAGAWGSDSGAGLAGAAYVFERNLGGPNAWGQRAKLVHPTPGMSDVFGTAVAIDGDTIAVGAPLDNQGGVIDRGSVLLFGRDPGTGDWTFRRLIAAPDGNVDQQFGFSVALQGDRLVVGATGSTVQGNGSGAAYVFERNLGGAGQWGLSATLWGSDVDANDQFGHSVTLDGDRIVVGANKKDRNGLFAGAVYIFELSGGVWGETATFAATNPVNLQEFGSAVSLSGDVLLIGAVRTPGPGGVPSAGAAFVYARDAGTGQWSETDVVLPQDPAEEDLLGGSVALLPDGDGWLGFVGVRGDGGPDVPLTGSVRALTLGTDAPCPADLAAPFGLLNVFDIQAYIGLYNAQNPAADLAAPFGVFNIFDLQAYIGLYNAGCP